MKEFLVPLGMTQSDLAAKMGDDVQPVNLIINVRRSVTASMAIKLAAALGTSPEFWLNLQMHCDLWDERQKLERKA